MKRDSVDIFSDGEIASSMQKSSNDCGNDVTKNRSSENNGNKTSTDIKGKLSKRDINKSLDESSNKSFNIMNKETDRNSRKENINYRRKYGKTYQTN